MHKNIERIDNSAEVFVFVSIILFFVLDFVNGVYFYFNNSSVLSISYVPKILWQLVLFSFLALRIRELDIKVSSFFLFYFVVIVFGFYRFQEDLFSLIWGLKHLNKLFLFFFVYILLELYRINLKPILNLLDYVFFINSIIIIIGFVFSIEFFKSYPFTDRFGYNGVFARVANGDVSFFYLIGNYYLFYRWKKNEINIIFLLFVVFSSFLVGTKAIYFQNILLLGYVFVTEKMLRKYIVAFGVVVLLFVVYFYNFSFWEDLLKEKGFLSVVTSKRSDLFSEKIPLLMNNISICGLFFGIKEPFKFFVEMDIIDLLITMGIVGSTLLAVFYRRVLFNFNSNEHFAWFFVIVYVIMITVTSRYMYSGTNAVNFPLFLFYLKHSKLQQSKIQI